MSMIIDGISSFISNALKPGAAKYLPLPTVSHVNLERYEGKWYEIATIPQVYEKGTHCTTAEYHLRKDGTVSVLNTTRKIEGEQLKTITGKAFPDKEKPGKLEVQFWWPFRGLYWIIDLDTEGYTYSVVGHPNRKYLWILSRTPQMDNALYNRIIENVRQKGFPIERIRKTDQSCNLAA